MALALWGSGPLHAQVQTAYLMTDSTGIKLIDGTDLTWSDITDTTLQLHEFDAQTLAMFQVQLGSTPTSQTRIRLELSNDTDTRHLLIDGTELKDDQGTVLASGLQANQQIEIVRCGADRMYRLDGAQLHAEIVDSTLAVAGRITVEQGTGETLLASIDTAAVDDCDTSIQAVTLPLPALPSMAHTDGSTIYLRWALPTYTLWEAGNQAGFVIERFTLMQSDTFVGAAARQASRVVGGPLTPLAEAAWDTEFDPNYACAQVAKGTLYAPDTLVMPQDTPSLADALVHDESKEARYVFALMVADQDFEVAAGLALAYKDTTAVPGEQYVYKIRMNSMDSALLAMYAYLQIGLEDTTTLPAPDSLSGAGSDHRATLRWNVFDHAEIYSSYDIERSTDGTNFSAVNEVPFVFIPTDELTEEQATYQDSLTDNQTTYHYRVRGRTPFGFLGPASAVVQVTGVDPRLDLTLRLDTIICTETDITLDWAGFDGSLQSSISGFNVHRSKLSDAGFEVINGSLLPASQRSFVDNNPEVAGYYFLECVDVNGHIYRSVTELAQVKDTTPPAIPVNLMGAFTSSTTVVVTWDTVPDPDLKGYKVFAGNMRNGTFAQLTEAVLREERYVYEVDPNLLIDSIYFKVLAADQRENCSAKSVALALARPDVNPPAVPVLHKAVPTPAGVELGWHFSESPDVSYHELQRKPAHLTGWNVLMTLDTAQASAFEQNLDTSGITATNYVDTSATEKQSYTYRLLAYDEMGNVSSSEVITVRPFDSRRKADIASFDVDMLCIPDPGVALQDDYQLLDYVLVTFENTDTINMDSLMRLAFLMVITNAEYNDLITQTDAEIYTFLAARKLNHFDGQVQATVTLSWQLTPDEFFRDYQIYRSVNGSPVMLYKTLTPAMLTGTSYEDTDVIPGYRYLYQMMARYDDGSFSPLTEIKMVRVPSSL